MNCRSNNFNITGKIGEGAHGVVLRAFDVKNKQYVALKRTLTAKKEDKINTSTVREINSLLQLNSPYVVRLLGIIVDDASLVLVLELMAGGLGTVLYDVEHPVSIPQCKAYARMLLCGLHHLHQISIMHRDLKPANLLIGYDGILRIADFGQARLSKGRPFSHQVGSRWYRSPELLYGSRRYSASVDMWAVGCILAEIFNKSPLFPGESDIEQLAIVIRHLGSPSEDQWPGVHNLPDYDKISFPIAKSKSWRSLMPDAPPGAVDLVRSLVVYNPEQRLTAEQALHHRFFLMDPLPLLDEEMSLPASLRGRLVGQKRLTIDIDKPLQEMYSDFSMMF